MSAVCEPQAFVAGPLPAARLYVWGISHHTSSLAEREALALDGTGRARLDRWLAAHTWHKEHLVLATCNRLEIYCVTREPVFADAVADQVAYTTGVDRRQLAAQSYTHVGEAAVRHLFRVCAGIDSQIVGEPEILGQVKASYEAANAAGQLGPWLHRVFQKAFQAAKWVRTHTRIARGQTSVGAVTVELAERICGDLRKAKILVLGAGEVAESTLHSLQKRGARKMWLANRTPAAAERLADTVGGAALPFAEWAQQLRNMDLLIASTAAPQPLLSVEMATTAMRHRRGRPLCLIDLAMPRNVVPETGALANVFYYDLDNLAAVANENLVERRSEVRQCEKVLAERSARLWSNWWPQVLRYFREG